MFWKHVSIRPCANNIAYNSTEALENKLPGNPVLSILQLIFYPGVNILDSSQLVSILWQKSLGYVSTIPGCRGLYWAPVDDKHASSSVEQQQQQQQQQRIIVLIQWETGHAWKLFQFSPGFSMMLGYLNSIYNRCIQHALPANLLSVDSVLELVSFKLFPSTSHSGDAKSGFQQKWETIVSSHMGVDDSELIYPCGEWLEADSASEDPFFVGLLFWKPDTNIQHELEKEEANIPILKHQLMKAAANVVSVYTTQLNRISPDSCGPESGLLPESAAVQFATNHPIFQISVTPEYNLNEVVFADFQDQFHLESARQTGGFVPQRIACGPAGNWYPMGYLSQHHLPELPRPVWPGTECTKEVIYFRGNLGDVDTFCHFELLRYRLWKFLGPESKQFWGKDRDTEEESVDQVSLFIVVRQQNKKTRTQIQRFIREFSIGCGDAIQDLSHKRTVGSSSVFDVISGKEVDITTFDVSENGMDQVSFQYAYDNYRDTTHQQPTRRCIQLPFSIGEQSGGGGDGPPPRSIFDVPIDRWK